MTRHFVRNSLAVAVCLAVSLAHGKPGGKLSPGGQWSQRTHTGRVLVAPHPHVAAGVAVAKHTERAVLAAGGAGYATVRKTFRHPHLYGPQWYGAHPHAWANSGWTAGQVWVPTNFRTIVTRCGIRSTAPISYNYGVNVTSADGNVIVDGQTVGTVAEFSQQAADLAATGSAATTSETDEWLPLGVFAMVRDASREPQLIVQLAINQRSILRGNFTDLVTNVTSPIHGAVDNRSQRAAWTVGDNTQAVMEAGLNELTESEAPALVHKNGQTDHWILVRLEQPQQPADATEASPQKQ